MKKMIVTAKKEKVAVGGARPSCDKTRSDNSTSTQQHASTSTQSIFPTDKTSEIYDILSDHFLE